MKKELLKLICKKNKKYKFDKVEKNRILFETSWQLGDCVTNSGFLEDIYLKYKDVKIDVIVRENSLSMYKFVPYVENIYPYRNIKYKNKIFRYINKLYFAIKNRNKYDIVISYEENINTFHLLWLKILNAKYIISYNKNLKYGLERKDLELFDSYFNDRSDLAKKLEIEVESKYKIYLGKYEQVGNNFFDEKRINVIFNYIGSSSNRILQETEVSEILKNLSEFNVNIYVSSTPEKYEYSRALINKLNKPNLMMLPYTKNIFEIASFVKESTIVVSVDTSIVHIASAYNKKILGFYLNDKDIFEAAKPKSDIYEIVFSEKKDKIINLNLSIIKKKFGKLV